MKTIIIVSQWDTRNEPGGVRKSSFTGVIPCSSCDGLSPLVLVPLNVWFHVRMRLLNMWCSSSTAWFPKIWYQRRNKRMPRATPYRQTLFDDQSSMKKNKDFTWELLQARKYPLITLQIQWACQRWWTRWGRRVRILYENENEKEMFCSVSLDKSKLLSEFSSREKSLSFSVTLPLIK